MTKFLGLEILNWIFSKFNKILLSMQYAEITLLLWKQIRINYIIKSLILESKFSRITTWRLNSIKLFVDFFWVLIINRIFQNLIKISLFAIFYIFYIFLYFFIYFLFFIFCIFFIFFLFLILMISLHLLSSWWINTLIYLKIFFS